MSHVEITVTVRAREGAALDAAEAPEVIRTMGGSAFVLPADAALEVHARFVLPPGGAHPAHVLQFVDLAHTIAQEALEP